MADLNVEAEEGELRVTKDKLVLTVHDGLGLVNAEVPLSEVDSVGFTRGTVRDNVGRLTVSSKGVERLAATIPNGKSAQVLKALMRVEEDAQPKSAATAEKR